MEVGMLTMKGIILYHEIVRYLDIIAVQRVSGESYATLPDAVGAPISGTARAIHRLSIISEQGSGKVFWALQDGMGKVQRMITGLQLSLKLRMCEHR